MHSDCFCDYDMPSVYRCTVRTARTAKRCTECDRTIHKGEHFEDVWGIWDREVNTYRICCRCLSLRDFIKQNVKCFCSAFGDLHNDAIETARGYHEPGNGLLFGVYRRHLISKRNEIFKAK